MASKRILLHMGTHKTGTTSFQQTFARQRDALIAAGIHYVGPGAPYPHLYSAFMENPLSFEWNAVHKLSEAEIRERDAAALVDLERRINKSKAGTVVVSSEYLSMLSKPKMVELRDYFAAFGEVHAVYYYRELHSWISSDSQQLAKAGLRVRPTHFRTAIQRLYDFPLMIKDVFGDDVTFIKYEDAAKRGICNTFLSAFGFPTLDELDLTEFRANEGISDNAVRALFVYNRLHPLGDPGRDQATVERLQSLPGQKYRTAGFPQERLRNYANKRAEVVEKLGLDLAPVEELPVSPMADPLVEELLQILEAAMEQEKTPA